MPSRGKNKKLPGPPARTKRRAPNRVSGMHSPVKRHPKSHWGERRYNFGGTTVKPAWHFFRVALTLALVITSTAKATPNETEIASAGTSTLHATMGGKLIEIKFTTVQVKNSDPLFPMEPDYAKEVSVIQRMT